MVCSICKCAITVRKEQCIKPPDKSAYLENYFSYFSTQTYVVGTQKKHLNEMVLLSTQNTCLNWWVRNNYNFTLKKVALSKPMVLLLVSIQVYSIYTYLRVL